MNWRNYVSPLVRLYWRTFKPRTYGVKALIEHPDGKGRILLVRHSYGDLKLWNLPGGGFNPKRETPIEAAIREVKEELEVQLINPHELCIYETSGEGKRDQVTVVIGSVTHERFPVSQEIANYKWEEASVILSNVDGDMARIARYALRHINEVK